MLDGGPLIYCVNVILELNWTTSKSNQTHQGIDRRTRCNLTRLGPSDRQTDAIPSASSPEQSLLTFVGDRQLATELAAGLNVHNGQ